MTEVLVVPYPIWTATWEGLKQRGAGRREAACVWGGRRRGSLWQVKAVFFIDDLAGTAAEDLQHRTPPEATAALFDALREHELAIAADIHTHPEDWVDLSPVDRRHPIEYRVGLIALVLPWYAMEPPSIEALGFHRYDGEGEWTQLHDEEVTQALVIERSES